MCCERHSNQTFLSLTVQGDSKKKCWDDVLKAECSKKSRSFLKTQRLNFKATDYKVKYILNHV